VLNDFEKLTVGMTIILVPEVAYSAEFLVTFNHAFAILAMAGVAVAEFGGALYVLNRF
jgi:hypothetical protein